MSQPDRPDDEPEVDTNIGKFPNGMPRVVFGTHYKDGIQHVTVNGVEEPVWSDHSLMVEMGWAACTHVHPKETWPGCPIEMVHDHLGYDDTAQEAFDTAVEIQKELEAQGEFVPIYVRY